MTYSATLKKPSLAGTAEMLNADLLCLHLTNFQELTIMLKDGTGVLSAFIVVGTPPAQRRRYVDANEPVLATADDFQNRGDMEYLRAIAHNLGF